MEEKARSSVWFECIWISCQEIFDWFEKIVSHSFLRGDWQGQQYSWTFWAWANSHKTRERIFVLDRAKSCCSCRLYQWKPERLHLLCKTNEWLKTDRRQQVSLFDHDNTDRTRRRDCPTRRILGSNAKKRQRWISFRLDLLEKLNYMIELYPYSRTRFAVDVNLRLVRLTILNVYWGLELSFLSVPNVC